MCRHFGEHCTAVQTLYAVRDHSHKVRYMTMEFSRRDARTSHDLISIIRMDERIEFTSVYRQDFLAGRASLMAG